MTALIDTQAIETTATADFPVVTAPVDHAPQRWRDDLVEAFMRWVMIRHSAAGARLHNRLLMIAVALTAALGLWEIGHRPGVFNGADLLISGLVLWAVVLISRVVGQGLARLKSASGTAAARGL